MTLWSATAAATATGGANTRSWRAHGVSIDTRTLEPDDLFIAVRGPSFDGHDFVAQGFQAGAAAAMVSRRPPELGDGELGDQAPLLMVDDTDRALAALAAAARLRTGARIAAITGSVGKTGTKDALRLALSEQGRTEASAGSLNNHWGVPLSLARMAADAAYGVFEVGMNHAGQITPLARLIRPHVALITTVEPAHAEFFPSVEAIADAKAEIFLGVEPGGIAVLNADNRHFARLTCAARAAGIDRIIPFGSGEDAEVRLLDCDLAPYMSRITAQVRGRRLDYHLPLPGRHLVINSLGVLATVDALGADVARAATSLARLAALDGRGRRHVVHAGAGDFTVVDESYNASPASIRAAAATLANMQPDGGGRRVMVLGDMRELGANSAAEHAGLAPVLEAAAIELVFTAGTEMAHLWNALPAAMQAGHADHADALAPMVAAAARPGDVVTVKGSLAGGLRAVVDALLARGAAPASPARAAPMANG